MADDLDDLLDEVELRFCRNVSETSVTSSTSKEDRDHSSGSKKKSERKSGTNGSGKSGLSKGSAEEEDIDAFLDDILDNDFDSLRLDEPKVARHDTKNSPLSPADRKCCPVFLGGSSVETGLGTSTSQRACNQLRCTSCDFRVTMFDDYEWDPSCDYLFFRNNMPSRERLHCKLRRRRGARAYACQCSWRSALRLTHLRDEARLKWVCGKHPG
uniref:Cilia- and flagella-associated protein 418 n=1 Tax=Paramormyrops kingsleyae TaxID=1676925 RepID=A0A3B3SR06_9TELE|nr:protein C8orf37 homolog [Paramormyrops kingsleyae]XP_023671249.1 protein C8orf37 homolog [Paramormyrops kingsleyae]XP_023671261.1 protein C8orf37 homolog [Paramormyrops kingsleyae]